VARHLFIVSRSSPGVYAQLRQEFVAEPDVTVIIDRRTAERRAPGDTGGATWERRRAQRRSNRRATEQLSSVGYAFVSLP
jgi:hypothetical protein